MKELITNMLYTDAGNAINNWAVFGFRILLSIELFRVHGLKKFRGDGGKQENVPNPLHLPQKLNNMMATLSDTIVPVFVILGLATRLAIIPTLSVTAIGYFVVHRNDPITVRDVPYIYTICFLLLLLTGPGSISLDHYLLTHFFTN